MLVAGNRDISEKVNQAFYLKLQKYGFDVTIFHFPDKDHVSIDYDLGKENEVVLPLVLSWIKGISEEK